MSTKKKLLIALLSATCLTAGVFAFTACSDSTVDPDSDVVAGLDGTDGKDGTNGTDGKDGSDGKDGTNGTDGATWLTGEGAPTATSGKAGDLYLDTTTADVYKKGTDSWTKIANIKGATGDKGDQGDSAYDSYLNSLGENDTQLTEEEWRASLVGATGTTPEVGANGNWFIGTTDTGVKAVGTDGVGITSIAFNTDATAFVVTFSDNTSKEVAFPSGSTTPDDGATETPSETPDDSTTQTPSETPSEEHTHKYSATVVLKDASITETGLGYQVCEADNSINLVVIPKTGYRINVYLSDGVTPANGALVSLGGSTSSVDSTGLVTYDVQNGKDYTVTVELNGYKLVETIDTTENSDIDIVLAKVYTRYYTKEGYVSDDPINAAGKYNLTTNSYVAELQLTATEDTVYTISGYNANRIQPSFYNVRQNVSSLDVLVYAGETKTIKFESVNEDELEFVTTIAAVKASARGTTEVPDTLRLGTNSYTVKANEDYIITINPTELGYDSKFYIELANDSEITEGITVTLNGETVELKNGDLDEVNILKLDALYGTDYNFVVTSATAGTVKFNLVQYYYVGEDGNPELITLGKATIAEQLYSYVYYYQYTAASTGDYVMKLDVGDSVAYGTDINELSSVENKCTLVHLEEGQKYFFKVSGDETATFTLDNYSETYAGIDSTVPLTITPDTDAVTVNNVQRAMFFKLTTTSAGMLGFKVTDADGNAITYLYNNNTYSATTVTFYSDANYEEELDSRQVDASAIVYVKVALNTTYYDATSYKVSASVTEVKTYEHTFTLKSDGATLAVSDVTVKVMNDDTVIASGTTNENGAVTLSFTPGIYTVAVEGLSDAYSYEDTVELTLPNDGSRDKGYNYDVTVFATKDYSFTVTAGDATATGAVVELYKADGEGFEYSTYKTFTVGTDTSIKVVPGTYKIVITNLPDGYRFTGADDLTYSTSGKCFTITEKTEETATYSYTIALTQTPSLKSGDNTVTLLQNGIDFVANYTADEAGEYTITLSDYNTMFFSNSDFSVYVGYTCVGKLSYDNTIVVDLSAGNNTIKVVAAAAFVQSGIKLNIAKGGYEYITSSEGDGTENAPYVYGAGNISHTNTSEDVFYKITGLEAGTYSVTLTTFDVSASKYLSVVDANNLTEDGYGTEFTYEGVFTFTVTDTSDEVYLGAYITAKAVISIEKLAYLPNEEYVRTIEDIAPLFEVETAGSYTFTYPEGYGDKIYVEVNGVKYSSVTDLDGNENVTVDLKAGDIVKIYSDTVYGNDSWDTVFISKS